LSSWRRYLADCCVDIADFYDKTAHLMDKVKKLVAAHSKPGEVIAVGIEDFMRAFGGAAWRTTDIFKLAQLNSAVSYSCFQMLGHKPIHVHPTV
jgi:hypothetical protein